MKLELDEKIVLIDQETLDQKLTVKESQLVNKILIIDPTKFGFKGDYLGISEIPKDLVSISD